MQKKQGRNTILKFSSFLMIATLLCGIVGLNIQPQIVTAEQIITEEGNDITVTDGDVIQTGYTYEVNYDGMAVITGYEGEETELVIPNEIDGYKVTEIKYSAFSGCGNLTSISVSEGITKIGSTAFSNCSSLESVNIPNSVTEIGYCAFMSCGSLTNINIPETVMVIGQSAFTGTPWLRIVTEDSDGLLIRNGVLLDGYYATGDVIIPEDVTEIQASAFSWNSNITSVSIPAGVTSIRDGAFVNCSKLTNINIPETVVEIGVMVFRGTPWLQKETEETNGLLIRNSELLEGYYAVGDVTIPEGVTELGAYAFENCEGITSVSIPKGVIKIESWVFQCCSNLKSVILPEGVTSIGYSTFWGCNSLESIIIPADVKEIGGEAFEECDLVTIYGYTGSYAEVYAEEKDIPFVSIGTVEDAFGENFIQTGYEYEVNEEGNAVITDYEGIETELVIPGELDGYKVIAIADNAFYNCSDVESISIPEGVTRVGEGAFRSCSNLKRVSIPEGVTEIGEGAFFYCSSLESISIPEGVTSIGDSTFAGCSSLISVNIPRGVTKIGYRVFADCDLLTIYGYAGSYAEDYAKENGIPFVFIDEEILATEISLNYENIVLNKGKTATLKATITPSNSTDTIKWTSSNSKVAKVSDKGVITALKKGTATITAKTTSGKTATCKVTVKEIKSTKIKLNKTNVTINKGKTVTLKATLTPNNSTDTIAWSSSKKSVAKVTGNGNKAVVTGLKKGTATITSKTSSGKKVTCKVTVKEIPATKIKLNKTSISLKVGKSVTLKATLTPKNSTDTIKWNSTKSKVAKVSDKGEVTAVKKGTATITAKTTRGKKVTCKVTVK